MVRLGNPQAHTGTTANAAGAEVDIGFQRSKDAVPDGGGPVLRRGGQQHGEFVAAQAGNDVVLPHPRADPHPDRDQNLVRRSITSGLLESLESIQGYQEQSGWRGAVSCGVLRFNERVHQSHAVAEPGQRIREDFPALFVARMVELLHQLPDVAFQLPDPSVNVRRKRPAWLGCVHEASMRRRVQSATAFGLATGLRRSSRNSR